MWWTNWATRLARVAGSEIFNVSFHLLHAYPEVVKCCSGESLSCYILRQGFNHSRLLKKQTQGVKEEIKLIICNFSFKKRIVFATYSNFYL